MQARRPPRDASAHVAAACPVKLLSASPMRVATPFRVEAELVEPLATWLTDAGYRVDAEIPILGRRADLVGAREGDLVAIELKMRDWSAALRQAIAYQLAANSAWVAMPLAGASLAYRQRWRFEGEGVGLLAVDDHGNVRMPIPAGSSLRLLPFVRERVLKRAAQSTVSSLPQARSGESLAP